jgi:hypothetical protein
MLCSKAVELYKVALEQSMKQSEATMKQNEVAMKQSDMAIEAKDELIRNLQQHLFMFAHLLFASVVA